MNLLERVISPPDEAMDNESSADEIVERLLLKMDDHDLLREVANDQKHMLKTMEEFIVASNARMGSIEEKQEKLEERHTKLENRMTYFCGALAAIMFVIEVFFKK